MHRAWRINGRGKTATVIMTDAEPSMPVSPGIPPLSTEERRQRLLAYLTQNMAATIATAILEEGA